VGWSGVGVVRYAGLADGGGRGRQTRPPRPMAPGASTMQVPIGIVSGGESPAARQHRDYGQADDRRRLRYG
jgi:hypothetical protein